MDWNVFLNQFAERPLLHSSMLSIFPDPPAHKQVQLSRWTKLGKLLQLRRGWYIIQKPWRVKDVPVAVIANQVVHPSYLSLDWALQYYEMIPEYVPNPTSVTTSRGVQFGVNGTLFIYSHIQPAFFKGYKQEEMNGYKMNMAYPEKALFDKIYLFIQRNKFSIEWLEGLRLQNLEAFDIERFQSFLTEKDKKNLREAVSSTCRYIENNKRS
ncbi:MAG: type IV toxin-antitoxin system AbiEi family antitoxin domain-containing protein [Candidatus Omnitrophota bacterium]